MQSTAPAIPSPGRTDALVVRWSAGRADRFGRRLATVALLGVLAACAAGSASVSASTATGGASTKTAAYVFPAGDPNTLEGRIANRMEGVQLDVLGGGEPAPGSTTAMVFHHGDWAAEAYWKTDGWCLARVYRWRVVDAVSETRFRLDYRVTEEYTDCIMHRSDHQLLEVTDVRDVDGVTTFDGRYAPPADVPTVRTACSAHWDAAAPCGFEGAAAVRPSPDL